jgi:hypothetical protein
MYDFDGNKSDIIVIYTELILPKFKYNELQNLHV